MTQTFKVDIKHQVKSLSNGLWNFAMIPLALIVLWFWKGINPFDVELIIVVSLCNLFWLIPVFVLHPTYYFLNKSTGLAIDLKNERVCITVKGNAMEFRMNELEEIERIYNSDNRHATWKQSYIPVAWRNYGLLRIVTSNNEEYFITSLMIDILNPPIQPTKNSFSLFPFPSNSYKKKQIEFIEREKMRRDKINLFKMNFTKLSENDLKSKSESDELVFEARIAAQEIICERHTAANITLDPAGGNV